ncbi:hypothetical protein PSP31121_05083 [Pandoraea sputorum]|uniref:Uncharacterized protein n=1 Tax=Pandoraea sputorum TaxID=93222 RepID=A0A5E5BJ13_9BURK|nr:hypothetical protein PSP31121_05083 [Pandoraea sputorum]
MRPVVRHSVKGGRRIGVMDGIYGVLNLGRSSKPRPESPASQKAWDGVRVTWVNSRHWAKCPASGLRKSGARSQWHLRAKGCGMGPKLDRKGGVRWVAKAPHAPLALPRRLMAVLRAGGPGPLL